MKQVRVILILVTLGACSGSKPTFTSAVAAAPVVTVPVRATPRSPHTLAVGDSIACAITANRDLACWGAVSSRVQRELAALDDVREVSIHFALVCVVRGTGHQTVCLGEHGGTVAGIPPSVRLAVGGDATCSAGVDGSVWCWRTPGAQVDVGTPDASVAPDAAHAVPFRIASIENAVDVAVGEPTACALLATGRVACFEPIPEPGIIATVDELPDEHVVEVAIRSFTTCVRDATSMSCFDLHVRHLDPHQDLVTSRAPTTVEIASDGQAGCALDRDGTVACGKQGRIASGAKRVRDAVELAVGWSVACVRRRDGAVACWGADVEHSGILSTSRPAISLAPHVVTDLPPAAMIRAEGDQTCATLVGGGTRCWGTDLRASADPDAIARQSAADPFVEVVESPAPCARTRFGFVDCWHRGDQAPTRMAGVAHAIAVLGDHEHGCALASDGAVGCWMGFDFPATRATPLDLGEPAVQIVNGNDLSICARLASGKVQCGETPAALRAISDATDLASNGRLVCALQKTQGATCVDFSPGQSEQLDPTEVAAELSRAGASLLSIAGVTCFADPAHRVQCLGAHLWPDDPERPHVIANTGSPIAIAAGNAGACVLRIDHTVACFGNWMNVHDPYTDPVTVDHPMVIPQAIRHVR